MNEIQNSVDLPNDYSRIIVGVDGSEGSVKALRHATGLARKFGSAVEAICVWSFPVAYSPLPVAWHPDEDAQRIVATVGDTVFGSTWPSWFTATIREGSPADILIAESSSADLIVVGSRGFGGFAGLLLGSVSAQCAEHAHCPVLVVPGGRSTRQSK
ncbi:universal stress protein [Leifsonia sp. YAF41]|uniref:universal stress protein n=1 Tax=Leifsonia sp. YAF41 TaxID=3233086 RepID=UPI003F9B26EE